MKIDKKMELFAGNWLFKEKVNELKKIDSEFVCRIEVYNLYECVQKFYFKAILAHQRCFIMTCHSLIHPKHFICSLMLFLLRSLYFVMSLLHNALGLNAHVHSVQQLIIPKRLLHKQK